MVNKSHIVLNLLALAMCQAGSRPEESPLIEAVEENGEVDLEEGLEEQPEAHFDNH